MIERDFVAEEERLVGGHRLDYVGRELPSLFLIFWTGSGMAVRPALRASGSGRGSTKILLVGGEIETGSALFRNLRRYS